MWLPVRNLINQAPSEKGSTQEGKNLVLESEFFPFRVGAYWQRRQNNICQLSPLQVYPFFLSFHTLWQRPEHMISIGLPYFFWSKQTIKKRVRLNLIMDVDQNVKAHSWEQLQQICSIIFLWPKKQRCTRISVLIYGENTAIKAT